jgi:hypothetical protein
MLQVDDAGIERVVRNDFAVSQSLKALVRSDFAEADSIEAGREAFCHLEATHESGSATVDGHLSS